MKTKPASSAIPLGLASGWLTWLAVILSVLTLFAPRWARAATVYIGNSLTVSDGGADGSPPFVILGEYSPAGPLATSSNIFPAAGRVTEMKFYGGNYNFTLYALSYVGPGSGSNEQTFQVVASNSFSGSAATGIQTIAVSNFVANAGDMLAFYGTGPYYTQFGTDDALNSAATYEDSSDPGSFVATRPGALGTEFTVGAYKYPSATYEYIPDTFGNQGRNYAIGVEFTPFLSFTALYNFSAQNPETGDNSDGANPYSQLVLGGDTLYGTAEMGGRAGTGAVFAVNTNGMSFTNLYIFTNGADGGYPEAGLILSGDTLYGTTLGGGSSGDGAVFAVRTNGTGFTNLYSFNGSDGASPVAELLLANHTLYGTAYQGGSAGWGTVFALNTNGTGFTNLYSFTNGGDGAIPEAGLALSGNTLFGTTANGGAGGVGTVFALSTNGTGFTTLYSFTNGSDGASPYAGLVLAGGTLYGTALNGGSAGRGTVFALNTNGGGFTSLHSFIGSGDGGNPEAGLILSGSTLYGTAGQGGISENGTVFALRTDGAGFTNLYSFTNGIDGASPDAGLVLAGTTLYGTAFYGGASTLPSTSGSGVVFALSLPPVPTMPLISWTNPAPITYGAPLSTNQLNATPSVPGDFAYTPANGSILEPGTNSLSVVFTPFDVGDYTSASNTVNLVVLPAPLTITAKNRTNIYGQTVTFAGTEFTTRGLVNGDAVTTVTLASAGAAPTATVAGSPYNIAPSAALGTGLANYVITYADGALTVAPAALTVTASNLTKTYGQPVTFAGTEFTPIGLLNSDTVNSVTLNSAGAAVTAIVANSPYKIVPGAALGAGLGNYVITYADGSLTVNPATLTITATNRTKTYGQTMTFAGTEFTAAGLVNSDTVTTVTLISPGAAAAATVTGSPYPIFPSAAAGAGLGNYTIIYVNGILTVTPAVPLLTWPNPGPITYGAPLTSNQLNATAGVGGIFIYTPPLGAVLNAGTNLLSVLFEPSNSISYTNATETVSLVVLPALLTVTANNATRFFGQANPSFTGTLIGVVNGDNITATYSSSATVSSPPGPYAIVPSLVDPNNRLFNYTVNKLNGVLTVNTANPWINPNGGVWSNPRNWLSNSVPEPYATVFITAPGVYQVILDTNAVVGSLVLGASSGSQSLLINSSNSLTLALSGMTMSTQGALVNNGQLILDANVTGGGSITNFGGLLAQSGSINILGNMVLGTSSSVTLPMNGAKKFEQINTGGFFQMGGAFNLQYTNTFVPGPSQSFRLLNWGSHVGGFATASGLTPANEFYLQGAADSSGLTLWTESLQGYPALPPATLVDQTVAVGATATFLIDPLGKPPFTFQWKFNGNPLTNTTSTLTIPDATTADAGTYCVVVVDATPVTNTYCATLSVLQPPVIVTQPVGVFVNGGGSASVSAVVTGDALQYEWWLNGVLLHGATNPAYAISNAQPLNGGIYTEAIYNAVGAVTSSPVTVVFAGPSLPFADEFADRGTMTGLSGVGTGSNLTGSRETGEPYIGGFFGDHSVWLQWSPPQTGLATITTQGSSFDTLLGVYTGTNLANLTEVAGDDDSGGHLTSRAQFYALAGTNYDIAVDGRGSNGAGNIVLSWSVATNALPIPIITQQPADTAVSLNGSASLIANALAPGLSSNFVCQWYNGGWLAVPDATNSTIVFPSVAPADVGFYSLEVTSSNGMLADTRQAALDIAPGGYHSYQKLQDLLDALAGLPSNLRKLDGGSAFQSVSIGTLGQLTLNNGAGQTSQQSCFNICDNAIYIGLTPTANGTFIVDDSCSTACTTFSDAVLNIYEYVSGNYNPVTCATYDSSLGYAQATFSATAGVDYVVEIDGANTMGGTAQLNYQFGVAPVSGIISPQNLTEKELSSFTLSSDMGNGALSVPNYQWYLNGNLISGATGTNDTVAAAQFNDAGTYSVVAANAFGSTGLIPVAQVTVPPYLSAPTLTAPPNGGPSTPVTSFSWSPVSGATGYQLVVATVSGDLPNAPESALGGPSVVINTNIVGNPASPGLSLRLPVNMTCYWEVQASNATQWGTWSSINSFSNSVSPPSFTEYSLQGGLLNLTVAPLTPQAILVISNSRDLRSWSFLTNSTNLSTNLTLSLDTNLLPLPQFLKASEH